MTTSDITIAHPRAVVYVYPAGKEIIAQNVSIYNFQIISLLI